MQAVHKERYLRKVSIVGGPEGFVLPGDTERGNGIFAQVGSVSVTEMLLHKQPTRGGVGGKESLGKDATHAAELKISDR